MSYGESSIPPRLPATGQPPQPTSWASEPGSSGSSIAPGSPTSLSPSSFVGMPPSATSSLVSLPPGTGGSVVVRRRPAWVIFLIVALVAILLGVATGLLLSRGTGGGGTGPSDTVLRFYQAVRDANAQAALAELAAKPADTSLMTDEVLRSAQASAPLTDITVPPTSSTVVQVSYRLGGEQLTDRVSVTAVGNGYKIITTPNGGGVQLTAIKRTGLSLSIAGKAVTQSSVLLLPGAYPLVGPSANLSYGQGLLKIKRIDDSGNVSELSPAITAKGLTAVKDATRASLTACTKQKTFKPTGCPFRYTGPNSSTADPSLATWAIVGDPTTDLRVTLGSDPTRADLQTNLVVRITVAPGMAPLDIPTNGARATVDLTKATPVVTWTV